MTPWLEPWALDLPFFHRRGIGYQVNSETTRAVPIFLILHPRLRCFPFNRTALVLHPKGSVTYGGNHPPYEDHVHIVIGSPDDVTNELFEILEEFTATI